MIDRRSLAELLPHRRWFGGKGRAIARVDVLDEAVLVDGAPALVFCIASVEFADGGVHLYSVPLLVNDDGTVRDALEEVGRLGVLGELMTQGDTIKGSSGVFHFGGPGLDPRSPPGGTSVRGIGVEQSNTSIVLDESVIMKLFRRVEAGPNPDLELSRLLTSEGFENIPAHVGEILYEGEIDETEAEIDLGVAQQFIVDGREGWTESLDHLRGLFDAADDDGEIEAAVVERASRSLEDLGRLGEVTAALHVVLAREELEPDVVGEPAVEHDVRAWADRVRAALGRLLDEGATDLAPHVEAIEDRIQALLALEDVGLKTRVHGDFHLGQVLLAPRGWMILDFEGEPARPLEDRRTKQSPLLDVAGMLRSFSYAASVALFHRARRDSDEWRKLEPWAAGWENEARHRFLSSYMRTSHEGGFLPPERSTQATMLDLFEIEKALYELGYERSHRPEWEHIPLRGLVRVLERVAKR